MSAGLRTGWPVGITRSDNEAKYCSHNPVVRRLVARFLQRVGDVVEAERPRTVLEVGSGEALVIAALRTRLSGVAFHGIEPDAEAAARARIRCPDVPILRADAGDLPFGPRSYDLVLCLEVLEHLREPERALREIRRVARRGCLLSVPHEPFFRLGNVLRGRHLGRLGNPSDHVQHWGAGQFTAFCARELAVHTATRSFPWLLVYGTV